MKWMLHEPGLWLLLLLGGVCIVLRLKRAEAFFREQYRDLQNRAES